MVTIKTTFISGEVKVTIEEPVAIPLCAAIRMVNTIDINEVAHKAPARVRYPDTIKFEVTNGLKSYTREISGIIYAGVIAFKERNPEELDYLWNKL